MYIIPKPYKVEEKEGQFLLPYDGVITIDNTCREAYFYATILKKEIRESAGLSLDIMAEETNNTVISLGLGLADEWKDTKEAYCLEVAPGKIRLAAFDAAGLFMGVQTLRQLIRQGKTVIPCMTVSDHPKISTRGYYLDVTRGRIPKL